jgi:creatinine amidohydrolase
LATDYLIAEAFARRASERTGALCTPTITVGVSPHHRQFHSTMWVDPPVFREYVESLTRNLTCHGIDRVIYISAHGGNIEHLREVGRRVRDEEVLYAIEWMWDQSIPEITNELFKHSGPHGGPKETALIQYLAGELVHEDRLTDARDGGTVDITTQDTIVNGARSTTTPSTTPKTASSATRPTRRRRRRTTVRCGLRATGPAV